MLFVMKHICKFSLKAAGHFCEEWVTVRLHIIMGDRWRFKVTFDSFTNLKSISENSVNQPQSRPGVAW